MNKNLMKLLEKAELRIKEEIGKIGFIDNSDNTDRFLESLAIEIANEEILKGNEDIDFFYEKESEIEELKEQLVDEIENNLMSKYNRVSELDESGNCTMFYYLVDKKFESIEEFNDYFKLGK